MVCHLEWKYLTLITFFLFIFINFSLTIPPILDSSKVKYQTEALKRGEFIVKNIARQNQKYLGIKNDSLVVDQLNITTELAQTEERILSLNMINPRTKRIIAPPERLDQPIDNRAAVLRGSEAKELMIEKLTTYQVLISQPIFLYSSAQDQEVVAAVVQAVFNIEGIGIASDEYTTILLKTLLLSFVLGLLFYFLVQQFTAAAFRKIYNEIEIALKKGYHHLELKTKFEEVNHIVHAINQVFKKTRDILAQLPEGTRPGGEKISENTDEILKNLLRSLTDGVAILNSSYQVIQLNPIFQKIIGIKESDISEKNILDLILDQELLRNISHGLGQAAFGMEVADQLFIHERPYRLTVRAAKNPNQEVDFYIVNLKEG